MPRKKARRNPLKSAQTKYSHFHNVVYNIIVGYQILRARDKFLSDTQTSRLIYQQKTTINMVLVRECKYYLSEDSTRSISVRKNALYAMGKMQNKGARMRCGEKS